MAAEHKGRGDGFSEERKRLFLVALRNGKSVLAACALVAISNRTAYNHRNRDDAFARDWDLAVRCCSVPIELAAYERALGVKEPVYRYGKLSHRRTRYSDPLLIALLKAEQPRKYGSGAGLRAERKRLNERLEAAVEPLRTELAQVKAELEAMRTIRTRGWDGVNFMNADAPREIAIAAPLRRERRGGWRLAAAVRRAGNVADPGLRREPAGKALDFRPGSGQTARDSKDRGSR